MNCYRKMVQKMVMLTNHVIDWAAFTMRGARGNLEIFAKSSCQISVKTRKKSYRLKAGRAPGIVPYCKSAPGYCITFTKKLHESLR